MLSDKSESEIVPGQQYMLDGKVIVTVIKALNRSKTSFSVEIPGRGIDTVERSRLIECSEQANAKEE